MADIIESQKTRMTEVGMDLWRSPGSTSLLKQSHLEPADSTVYMPLFVFEFGLEVLVHPNQPPGIFVWHGICWNRKPWAWAWRRWSLNMNQLYWAPLASRALSDMTLLSRSLKTRKSVLLKSRIVSLLFILLPQELRFLNSNIFWPPQLSLPLTFVSPTTLSLLVHMRSSRTLSFLASLLFRGESYTLHEPPVLLMAVVSSSQQIISLLVFPPILGLSNSVNSEGISQLDISFLEQIGQNGNHSSYGSVLSQFAEPVPWQFGKGCSRTNLN